MKEGLKVCYSNINRRRNKKSVKNMGVACDRTSIRSWNLIFLVVIEPYEK